LEGIEITDIVIKGSLITPTEQILNGQVEIEHNKITYVGPEKNESDGLIKDFKDCWIVPGFIDLHVHGGGGYDTSNASHDAINQLSYFLAGGGVTSFLATTLTTSLEKTIATCKFIRTLVEKGTSGAKILGLHLEGPYVNPKKKGALNVHNIRRPSINELQEVYQTTGDVLKVVTMAPELEGALKVITWLREHGIIAAAGHTEATYEEMMDGINAGISHTTHLYNTMRPFHHREPGAVGASLIDDRISVELIADGVHVHPVALKLTTKLKGVKKTVLVSDSIMPTGLPDGEYQYGHQKVFLKKGQCRLDSGVLAGSNIRLCDAVRNMVHLAGIPITQAIEMATLSPARVLSLEDQKGQLLPGRDADLIVLDKTFSVRCSMVNGKIIYEGK